MGNTGAVLPLGPAHALLPLLLASVLSGCALGAADPQTRPSENPRTAGASASTPGTPGTVPPTTEAPRPLEGRTVALDPGHNGGNAGSAEITRQVDDGRGGTKHCNTTGTATNSDYAEHAFNWEVALEVREQLEKQGASVVLSRDDDEGVGPCVDERGAFADDADLLVSIHANGTEDTSAQGFHVIVPEPLDDEVAATDLAADSADLGEVLVAAFEDADLSPNPAYGEDGLVARSDIAGLNHASVPAAMVECGEMRNVEDAARMESPEGRSVYASAISAGIEEYLIGD